MKTIHSLLLTILCLSCSWLSSAQEVENISKTINLTVVATDNIKGVANEGDTLTITSVIRDASKAKGFKYIISGTTASGLNFDIDCSKISKIPFKLPEITDKESYWNFKSIKESFVTLSKKMDVYSIRKMAAEESDNIMNEYKENGNIIEDPVLNDYITSLFIEVYPEQRLDFFNYNFSVAVIHSLEPYSYISPNGIFVISSGLLAQIHTEDELMAIICRECNHFICNHFIVNMAKVQKRLNIAAIADIASTVLVGKTTVATDIAKLVNDIGLNFDKTQEKDSDQAAVDMLPVLGYDVNAMATYVKRVGDYYIAEGKLTEVYNDKGTYPKLEDRLAATGTPYERRDKNYEQEVATCISYVASARFDKGQYELAASIVNQNIENGVASSDDFVLLGNSLMKVADNEENNNKVLNLFTTALSKDAENINAHKGYVSILFRLERYDEAKAALQEMLPLANDNSEIMAWIKGMDRQITRKMSNPS